MKTRLGFVSNSSSSSFVIIGNIDGCSLEKYITGGVVNVNEGEVDFGWQDHMYSDISDRFNLCQILIRDLVPVRDQPEFKERLLKAVQRRHPEVEYLVDVEGGYVDHQSAPEMKMLIFSGEEEDLYYFIFGVDSYISCDNDNH